MTQDTDTKDDDSNTDDNDEEDYKKSTMFIIGYLYIKIQDNPRKLTTKTRHTT